MRKVFFLFFLLTCQFNVLFGQSTLLISNHEKIYLQTKTYLYVLEDKQDQYQWNNLLSSPSFQAFSAGKAFNPWSAYWFKLHLENLSDFDKKLFLTFNRKLDVNLVDFYVLSKDSLLFSSKAGTYQAVEGLQGSSERFKVPIQIHKRQKLTILFKIRNITGYPVSPDSVISDANFSMMDDMGWGIIQIFLQGCLWMMLLYNCLLWFVSGYRAYFFYVLYLFSVILYILFQNFFLFYTAFSSFPQGAVYLNAFAEEFAQITYLWFINDFFWVKERFPKTHKIICWISGFLVFKFLFNFIILYLSFNLRVSDMLLAYPLPILLLTYLYLLLYISKDTGIAGKYLKTGTFILLSAVLLGTVGGILVINGILKISFAFVSYFIQVGVLAELVFFTLGLSFRQRQIEEEKRKVQEEVIELQKNTNLILEKKVEERTAELKTLNEEVNVINNNLGKIVKERTAELQIAIENLIEQNKELEEFSHIISHNLRAPVARILGLASLLDLKNLANPQNEQWLAFIVKSAENLDLIVKDLDKILNPTEHQQNVIEEVDFVLLIEQVNESLYSLIRENEAVIEMDVKNAPFIYSIKSYLTSIVFNLISNALKYSSPERKPVITITTSIQEKYTCILVADNGLGIDLPPNEIHKIFKLYKRVHTHTEGRGLGLYLVKNQVELLSGKIEVESKKDQGTVFKVYLPHSVSN